MSKAGRIPNSGYFELWLQRMARPNGIHYEPSEGLCRTVLDEDATLWNFDWIDSEEEKTTLSKYSIVDKSQLDEIEPVIKDSEIDDFWRDSPS